MTIMKKKKGFTLTEVLVVVLIVSILAAVAYPLYTKSITKSRAVEAIGLLEMVRNKQLSHFARSGEYFNNFADMGQLVSGSQPALLSENAQMQIKDYTLSLNTDTNCMNARYAKGSNSFTFSSSYENAGLGCTGSICTSFGGIVGDASSVCNCGNKVCNGDFVLNQDTCSCECTQTCSGNFTLDKESCRCTCGISCSGGQVKDAASCSCYCPPPVTFWNGSQCGCPSGQCLNGGACLTVDSVCEAGKVESERCGKNNSGERMRSCKAGCPNTWGSWSACVGACAYDEDYCAARGMLFDKNICTCKACPGSKESKDGVTCVCMLNAATCAKTQKTFDATSCSCKVCQPNFTSTDGINCSCSLDVETCAKEGKTFDAASCSCKACKPNFASTDGINCSCSLDAETCAKQGKIWGMISCTCKDCPVGRKTSNGVTCECSTTKAECTMQKKVLDSSSCECVSCQESECWNGSTCIDRNNKCLPDAVQKTSCGKGGIQSRYWDNSKCPAGWSAWSFCINSGVIGGGGMIAN